VFTVEEAATLLDVDSSYVRSQVHDRRGLCFEANRRRGAGITREELLALAVLTRVQRITGKQSPMAQAVVRAYKPFLAGVLETPGRTIPDVVIPLRDAGGAQLSVQLRLPHLAQWLRDRLVLLRAGQPLPQNCTPAAFEYEGIATTVGAGA
jgi:hypothetical protein